MRPLPSGVFNALKRQMVAPELRVQVRVLLDQRFWRPGRPSRLAESNAWHVLADEAEMDTVRLTFAYRLLLRELLGIRTPRLRLGIGVWRCAVTPTPICVHLRPRESFGRARESLRRAGVPDEIAIVPDSYPGQLGRRARLRFAAAWCRTVSPIAPPMWADDCDYHLRDRWWTLPLGPGACTFGFWAARTATSFPTLPRATPSNAAAWLASPYAVIREWGFTQLAYVSDDPAVPRSRGE